MRIEAGEGALRVATSGYVIDVDRAGRYARLDDPDGRSWLSLFLDASVHTTAALDETMRRRRPRITTGAEAWTLEIELESSAWDRKTIRLGGDETTIRFAVTVEGTGELTDVDLLGAWSSAEPRAGTGFHASGTAFRSLMSPGPSDPGQLVRSAAEPATLDVCAGSGPGRGNWFFTPPPLCFMGSRSAPRDDGSIPEGPWLAIGIECEVEAATFGAVRYEPGERSFSIRLEYEGQTRVKGRLETPTVVIHPGLSDPYAGVGAWSDALRCRGVRAGGARTEGRGVVGRSRLPGWWFEPMFCGWGAQCALAREIGGSPADHSNEAAYETFLDALEREGVEPGTIVIDDQWQRHDGLGNPDRERWPDLAAWIRARHERGQRVLLWWKCWDPDGIPAELCIRNRAGVAVAVDPSNPAYEALLRGEVRRMLGSPSETDDPGALDADGLKVDFSGLTPSGPSLRRVGPEWGVSLLHRLLVIIHDEAHRTKPDALVITHTPHPWFDDATDMVRLNDMLRLGEAADDRSTVVEQMRHRAAIVRAAMPDVPIDTDDWCAPDLPTWRRYLDAKLELGVPSLYYATALDLTGERFEARDYEAMRRVFAEARARAGLPARTARRAIGAGAS